MGVALRKRAGPASAGPVSFRRPRYGVTTTERSDASNVASSFG
jgi:hypothetical protein